jgi:protein-disulfide isomerase
LPWTSYVIVPLFALANTGIPVGLHALQAAYTSPITIGIIVAFVAGKPAAIIATSSVINRVSRGRIHAPVGWAAVLGSGTIAGVGFTVSVVIAGLVFRGTELNQAKLGVLTAAAIAALFTWLVFRSTELLSSTRRTRALVGSPDGLADLLQPVDTNRDHCRGPADASVTLVEYGDFQCPYCGLAESAVRSLDADEDVLFVWRHLPLVDVHPDAWLAAEAAEAAAVQGAFWEMHDLLIEHQDELKRDHLARYAEQLRLNVPEFKKALASRTQRSRIREDIASADLSGVSGTPTFFVNGRRHYGAYDAETLGAAVSAARAAIRAAL